MKISEKWLREWVSPQISTEELSHQLTMAGLEVDSVEYIRSTFTQVCVGEILACDKHPDADKLNVCAVSNGSETFQVVCGAPNARVGIKIPFAMVGAQLGEDFKIKRAKLRGIESEGMLCARSELGVSGDSSGLWELPSNAPLGDDLKNYIDLEDQIIEVDLTPNRADCLSVRGVAREVAVLNKVPSIEPEITAVEPDCNDFKNVVLSAQSACPRYVSRVVNDIDMSAVTPTWMQDKLAKSDIRSIDPIVDITNYVLMEFGQPMHAFDMDQLSGDINVRWSKVGESVVLLDGRSLALDDSTLLITDDSGPVAAAGVMGGKKTAVNASTRNVFLESAYFDPLAITGKARKYGLHTDASHRYERGVDYKLQTQAIERASQLMAEICGGSFGPIVESKLVEKLPEAKIVRVRLSRIERLIGQKFAADAVVDILSRLEFEPVQVETGVWDIQVPSWRFDISIEADLIEEIARVYGYDKLPENSIAAKPLPNSHSEANLSESCFSNHLVGQGFREIISYSFIDPAIQSLCFDEQPTVELLNPISSDLSVMRTSLIPGLIQSAAYNANRQHDRIRLFEIGMVFRPENTESKTESLEQSRYIGGIVAGQRSPSHWDHQDQKVDFFDLKAIVESFGELLRGRELSFKPLGETMVLHPGQSASICLDGKEVGIIGTVHPRITQSIGLELTPIVFELAVEMLLDSDVPKYHKLSKFPSVGRDLALIVDRNLSSSELTGLAKTVVGAKLESARIFDIYEGQGIDSNKKSLGLSLTFRDYSRTLNEEEITSMTQELLESAKSKFGAVQR